jgi:rod shape-determining protein MreD
MAKKVIWTCALIVAAALLQSAVFPHFLASVRIVPDLALVILVYSSYVNGTMTGQLSGFFSGFLLDFLSAAPLGLNAFVRTVAGALAGLLKDTFYLDFFFLPMALCAGATIFKALVLFLLQLLFPASVPSYTLGTLTFWIELGLNTLAAPIIFGLLKLFRPLKSKQKENGS